MKCQSLSPRRFDLGIVQYSLTLLYSYKRINYLPVPGPASGWIRIRSVLTVHVSDVLGELTVLLASACERLRSTFGSGLCIPGVKSLYGFSSSVCAVLVAGAQLTPDALDACELEAVEEASVRELMYGELLPWATQDRQGSLLLALNGTSTIGSWSTMPYLQVQSMLYQSTECSDSKLLLG